MNATTELSGCQAWERVSIVAAGPVPGEQLFPWGAAVRVKPILVFDAPRRADRTSWRNYGDIQTPEAAREEAARIEKELDQLKQKAEFPIHVHPVQVLDSQARLGEVRADDADFCILYAAGFCTQWPLNTPMVMFVRQRSGPFYLGFETAHWRFLRQSGDPFVLNGFDTDDVVVDSCDELLWRLRAMYGLKNATGTKMLTIGGLCAYSREAQENGPRVAKQVWGYDFIDVTDAEFAKRLGAARGDQQVVKQIESQTAALLSMPNVELQTDRKFVFNSFMALHVCRQFLRETGASNFGFAQCMGCQIAMLDTPPCFVLSLANDEGYTAYCHTDLSHTMPGVLLRWIASRPSFVCNSHYPHDGLFFVAHCQAPRRMNGRDFEPATIKTHYESDYGAACKTHYTKGQVVTVVVPNLVCSKWRGFRGKIVDAPSYPTACRSQMEIAVDGDWKRLLREMEGFHAQVVYGDYTREIGYALKKLGGKIQWDCFSEPA